MVRAIVTWIGFLAVSGIFAATGEAEAQQVPCGSYDAMISHLQKHYGETIRFRGLDTHGKIIEILASDRSGTWSVLQVFPSGMACLVSAGEGAEVVVAPVGDAS